MNTLLAIGIGGALGAITRHSLSSLITTIMGHGFPWGTLGINIIGSCIMGLGIAVFAQVWQPPESMRLLLVTGFLGAFTTFSAFSLDTITLWERGEVLSTLAYILASVILSIAALFFALTLGRTLLS